MHGDEILYIKSYPLKPIRISSSKEMKEELGGVLKGLEISGAAAPLRLQAWLQHASSCARKSYPKNRGIP